MNIPNHVGLIMDGNRRWASNKGLSSLEGHKAGYNNLKKLIPYIFKQNTKYVSIYAFSTENLNRSKEEVNNLFDLFLFAFNTDFKHFEKEKIKIIISGSLDNLPKKLITAIEKIQLRTKDNKKGILNICFNYGGITEIKDMVKIITRLVSTNEVDFNSIDENLIYNNLYNKLPNIDLLIRTSGEHRTSNFMPLHILYSEFYFPKIHFPDFNELEYDKAILEYNKRDKRYGK